MSGKVLIIRLSAMGDVAMTVPVIQKLIQTYPDIQFTLLTRTFFFPIFEHTTPSLKLIAIDDYLHRGFLGLFRLSKKLRKHRFTAIADLHNVLRTNVLKILLYDLSLQWATLNKNRAARKKLIGKTKQQLIQPLLPVYKIHQQVFEKLNLPIFLDEELLFNDSKKINAIGLAPGSKHHIKNWENKNNEKLIAYISQNTDTTVYLFGDPNSEKEMLDTLAKGNEQVETTFHLSLSEQLQLIEKLKVMVSMDSSNMHLASAVGTPVLSVWCATSPLAGFLGYGQDKTNVVSLNLDCSPCSIYGNKKCWRGDLACTKITIQLIQEKLLPFIE